MKTLTITANDPMEERDILIALKAGALLGVIEDLRENLRQMYKYQDVETIKIEELREKLWQLIKDHGVEELFC